MHRALFTTTMGLLTTLRSLTPRIIGWFSNRTETSVDDGARKSNNWLDQWLSVKLGTGSRVLSFPRAFLTSNDVPMLLLNQPNTYDVRWCSCITEVGGTSNLPGAFPAICEQWCSMVLLRFLIIEGWRRKDKRFVTDHHLNRDMFTWQRFFSHWRRIINPKRLCLKHLTLFDISLPNIISSNIPLSYLSYENAALEIKYEN